MSSFQALGSEEFRKELLEAVTTYKEGPFYQKVGGDPRRKNWFGILRDEILEKDEG